MRNYTIGRIWGIPIRLNLSLLVFLPVLAWLIASGTQIETYAGLVTGLSGVQFDPAVLRAGATPWVIGIAAAIGLFVSVAVHELGHSWAAMRYGLRVESITLWILGGLANLESIPREWQKEFWIAVAGPVTSLLVAGVSYGLLVVTAGASQVLAFVFGWLAVTNIVLAVFNMLPAFPMDGGRVLRALLARSRPYASATRIAGRVGATFAVLFAVVGVLSFSPLLLLLAFFIYSGATTESRTVLLDEMLEGLTVEDVTNGDAAAVDADTPLPDLIDRMVRERRTAFPVVDGRDVVGLVTLASVDRVPKRDREAALVADALVDDALRFAPGDDAFEALVALSSARADAALVMTADGVGIVRQSDFTDAITLRKQVGEW